MVTLLCITPIVTLLTGLLLACRSSRDRNEPS